MTSFDLSFCQFLLYIHRIINFFVLNVVLKFFAYSIIERYLKKALIKALKLKKGKNECGEKSVYGIPTLPPKVNCQYQGRFLKFLNFFLLEIILQDHKFTFYF